MEATNTLQLTVVHSLHLLNLNAVYLTAEALKMHQLDVGDFVLIRFSNATTPFLVQAYNALNTEIQCVGQKEGFSLTTTDCVLSVVLAPGLDTEQLGVLRNVLLVLPPLKRRLMPLATSVVASVVDFSLQQSLLSVQSIAGLLLNNAVVVPGLFIPIDWFNKKDYLYVRDFISDAKTNSSVTVAKITDKTDVTFVSWDREKLFQEHKKESKMAPGSLSAPIKVPSQEEWLSKIREEVGGLESVLPKIVKTVHRTFYPIAGHAGEKQGRGIIFYGLPGTGKSFTASTIAKSFDGMKSFFITGDEIFTAVEGESSLKLSNIFQDFRTSASYQPSLLVIDNFEAIGTDRILVENHVERQVASQLAEEMDFLTSYGLSALVIGITHDIRTIDRSLLQPLRFEHHFEFKLPSFKERRDIFERKLKKIVRTVGDSDGSNNDLISEIVRATHGFSGADLDRLISQTVINIVSRGKVFETNVPSKALYPKTKDFLDALNEVKPSTLVEFEGLGSIPPVYFSEFSGIDDIIENLQINIISPLKNPQALKEMGAHAPSGVIFYGPPGTGKTKLAQAVACEAGVNFIEISGAMVISKYAGDGPRAISKIFGLARSSAPCILFIDQIDSIARERGNDMSSSGENDRMLTTLLTEMDGVLDTTNSSPVIVLAATTNISQIDAALLRPGRIDVRVELKIPGRETRQKIISKILSDKPTNISPNFMEKILDKTRGCTPAALVHLYQEAVMYALRTNLDVTEIGEHDFEYALNRISIGNN